MLTLLRIAYTTELVFLLRAAVVNVFVMSVLVLVVAWPFMLPFVQGNNDFLSFYAGGTLAFTSNLYNPDALLAVQQNICSDAADYLRFVRLPHHAVAFAPLALLPYSVAYPLWQVLNLAAIIAAVYLWPCNRGMFAWLASVWIPLYMSLLAGQDQGVLLLFVVCFIRWNSAPAFLGAVWKFHYSWLLPLTLERRCVFRSSLAMLALLAIPMLWYPYWPVEYIRTVVQSRSVVSATENLFPYLGWYGFPIAAALGFWIVGRLERPIAIAALILLGVLVAPHAFKYDYSVALPLVALLCEKLSSQTRCPTPGNSKLS